MVIYLDNAATTRISPEVLAEMEPFLGESFGNPSSRHPVGLEVAEAVERARRRVARATGAAPEDVFFTSGGTEANNLAVLGHARANRRKGRHVLIGPTEHPSVRDSARALEEEGFEVDHARLDADGNLDFDDIGERLRQDTVVVAQMLVNNEFGTIYPVAGLARIVRRRAPQAVFHVDAVQALGKLEVSLDDLGAQSLSISAHKIHGPKGSGALALARGVRPRPLVFGGSQEGGVRSGTENVAGLVALGKAAEIAATTVDATVAHLRELRGRLESELHKVTGATLLRPGAEVAPGICAVLLPGPPAEVWMHHLEVRGVMTSVGSACQAKKAGVSPALRALGLDAESAKRVLRISFARETRSEEVEEAVAFLAEVERDLGAPR